MAQHWPRSISSSPVTRVAVRRPRAARSATSYVFMSNHRSNLDVLALVEACGNFSCGGWRRKSSSGSRGFGWWPCVRRSRSGEIVPITREAVASLAPRTAHARRASRSCSSPRGPRGCGGEMLPFKKGVRVRDRDRGDDRGRSRSAARRASCRARLDSSPWRRRARVDLPSHSGAAVCDRAARHASRQRARRHRGAIVVIDAPASVAPSGRAGIGAVGNALVGGALTPDGTLGAA